MDYPILSVADIEIPERLRKEHGDIEDFAAEIAELGHLIQPIVLNRLEVEVPDPTTGHASFVKKVTYRLMAGGRRTKALDLLGWPLRHGIEYVFKSEVPPDVALEIELAENMSRLDMTWQEEAISIRKIHSLKVKLAADAGTDWGQVETGKLLGMGQSNVSHLVELAKVLEDSSNPERQKWVTGAANYRDGINRLMKWKEDEGMKYLAQHLIEKPSQVPMNKFIPTSDAALDDADYELAESDGSVGTPEEELAKAVEASPITTISISSMLKNESWEVGFAAMADGSLDAHIITDPPYGIEMDHLEGSAIESVRAEHDVEDNLAMLRKFIPEAYRVLSDKRFMLLFCDMEHFDKLIDIGKAAGFKVQRWPIVWVKTHHCQNNCAQYNFTKATEDAILFRKGDAILARPPQTNYYIGDNVATKAKHGGHPFVKPPELWTWLATHIALKGQTIVDPFMGEASCGEAVLPMGWKYLGWEINETHYSKAVVFLCDFYTSIYHGKVRFV